MRPLALIARDAKALFHSGEISMKFAINNPHVRGNCFVVFQGQGVKGQNNIDAKREYRSPSVIGVSEADRSTAWRRSSVVSKDI